MMRTKYLMDNSTVSVVKLNDDTALDELPAQVYSLQSDKKSEQFYLTIVKSRLQVPEKIYGNQDSRVQKCVQTYLEREASTGILMTGDKGSGKSLLMSLLANEVIDQLSLPVILVQEAHKGEKFMTFLEAIGECCLVFDEVAKMYHSSKYEDGPKQNSLLPLLDGVDKTKRLIIMTENDEFQISDFMLNRPSRLYYHFRYSKLEEENIVSYCKEYKLKKAITDEIIDVSRQSRIFSFDMLQSIVTEHLRFDSSVKEILTELNVSIQREVEKQMEITKITNSTSNAEHKMHSCKIVTKPGKRDTYIKVKKIDSEPPLAADGMREIYSDDDDDYFSLDIKQDHLKYEISGSLIYEVGGYVIQAKEILVSQVNYGNLV